MLRTKYIIPTLTLSVSCYPADPIKENLCNIFQSGDPAGNIHIADSWRESYCSSGLFGDWEARSFGYWNTLPLYESSSSQYGYGDFSYTISGDLYISPDQANLYFQVQFNFYGMDYSYDYAFDGNWEAIENQYMISMSGNQGEVDMECTQDNLFLDCYLINSFMGSGMNASFEKLE